MEALTTIGIDWRLLIAQVVNFFILLLVLHRFAYKPILRMLEKRSVTIAKSLEDAKAIEENRKQSDAERQRTVGSAQHEAERIVAEARGQAEELRGSLIAKAKEEANHVLMQAHKEADRQKREVVDAAREELADIVVTASGKIIGEKLTTERDRKFVEEALHNYER